MSKKCLYCNTELKENSVIDFCESCGKGVWGERMFNTIIKNMEDARKNNNLCNAGKVSEAGKETIF